MRYRMTSPKIKSDSHTRASFTHLLLSALVILGVIFFGEWVVQAKESGSQATVLHTGKMEMRQVGGGKAIIEKLALGKNAFVGKLTLAAGASVPVHRDITEEYLYILKGGGTLVIDGQSHKIQAGSAIYMPAKAEVHFKNGPTPLVALQVFAGPESANKYEKWEKVPSSK